MVVDTIKKNNNMKIISGSDDVFIAAPPFPFFVLNLDIL
jgi:hypothetical protein